jgi:hypothetical protein
MPGISLTNPASITSLTLRPVTGTASKLEGVVNLSKYTSLVKVDCGENDITAINSDLSINTSLEEFSFRDNKLTGNAPDLSANANCTHIRLDKNELSGPLPSPLPTGIQEFKAFNNNFATTDTTGTAYSTIAAGSGTLAKGAVFTKTDEETFTIVATSATTAGDADFIHLVDSTNSLIAGKHRVTFDVIVNPVSGTTAEQSIAKVDLYYQTTSVDIQEGSNVIDFDISATPSSTFIIRLRIVAGFIGDLSFTNFKVIQKGSDYGPIGFPDFSTLTSLAHYNVEKQSDSFGASINTYGHDSNSNANRVLNYSGPSELENTAITTAEGIEGAIPESIRILNLNSTNISKNSKRILLTQLYDTFKDKGIVSAGSFVSGRSYKIVTPGDTDFTALGAADSAVGTVFTTTGAGTSGETGTARDMTNQWAKTTAVNGVTYSNPVIKAGNNRGSWNRTTTGTLGAHQKLIGKHSAVATGNALDDLADVGFTLNGFS